MAASGKIAKAAIRQSDPGFGGYLCNELRCELIETIGILAVGGLVVFNRRDDSFGAFFGDLPIDWNQAQDQTNGCQVDRKPNQPLLSA